MTTSFLLKVGQGSLHLPLQQTTPLLGLSRMEASHG
jgi:hypothetical protein